MLAYVLALSVGLGSIAVYMTAFFFPEIHRKNDFIWSGVGLFYALVIWIFARRISGGLLLGHVASISLLYWFGWQTFSLRRQVTPAIQQTPVPSTEQLQSTITDQVNKLSLPDKLTGLKSSFSRVFGGVQDKIKDRTSASKPVKTPTTTPVIVDTPTKILDELSDMVAEPPAEVVETKSEETVVENPVTDVVNVPPIVVIDNTTADVPSSAVVEESPENGDSSHS
ncbi:Ycf66 family protein [Calothrix sp. PCC 6303]|uniref:Ycf66 family protein n=1 Tax=Calothrix sp. PCC 6303 TaxID=1170562 RepID=UPI0002A019B9|nr:Ycf66 family protein [Calothrix sp. PCC 6303]AFZ02689.1 Ycf66 family protein [Calothrix sp. PCC 6303]